MDWIVIISCRNDRRVRENSIEVSQWEEKICSIRHVRICAETFSNFVFSKILKKKKTRFCLFVHFFSRSKRWKCNWQTDFIRNVQVTSLIDWKTTVWWYFSARFGLFVVLILFLVVFYVSQRFPSKLKIPHEIEVVFPGQLIDSQIRFDVLISTFQRIILHIAHGSSIIIHRVRGKSGGTITLLNSKKKFVQLCLNLKKWRKVFIRSTELVIFNRHFSPRIIWLFKTKKCFQNSFIDTNVKMRRVKLFQKLFNISNHWLAFFVILWLFVIIRKRHHV